MSRTNPISRALMRLSIMLSLVVLSCRFASNIQDLFATPTPTFTLTPTPTLTLTPTFTLTPSPTPMGGAEWIVFASKANNEDDSDIYAIRVDGLDVRRLTSETSNEWSPALSPDGQQVVFVSDRDGDKNLYLINIDGSDVRQLTYVDDDDYDPAWSPDGQQIAFVRKRSGGDIWILSLADGREKRVTYDDFSDEDPSWSPDGRFIAYSSFREKGEYDIYMVGVDGTQSRQVTEGRDFDRSPKWSPDGHIIAFTRWNTSDIEKNRTFWLGETWDEQMSIIYIDKLEFHDLRGSIYTVRTDGSELRQLTEADYDSWMPCWSPDGRWIVFASNRGGSTNIYRMRLDGSQLSPVRSSSNIDSMPNWGGGVWSADATQRWQTIFTDTFDNNQNSWSTGAFPGANARQYWVTLTADIVDGVLRVEGESKRDVNWWLYPAIRSTSDFYLSISLKLTSMSKDADIGVAFRGSNRGFYRFIITPRLQEFAFDMLNQDKWTDIIVPTYDTVIVPDGWNKIEVRASGTSFTFWINGKLVGTAQDSTFSSGKMGVAIQLDRAGDKGIFEFDNLEVQAP